MKEITGGALIAQMLKAEDVEVVFGIIDGSYFGLYGSLRDVGIRLVTPRHETSAVHMAMPADGPSLGVAPSGTCTWTSEVW